MATYGTGTYGSGTYGAATAIPDVHPLRLEYQEKAVLSFRER